MVHFLENSALIQTAIFSVLFKPVLSSVSFVSFLLKSIISTEFRHALLSRNFKHNTKEKHQLKGFVACLIPFWLRPYPVMTLGQLSPFRRVGWTHSITLIAFTFLTTLIWPLLSHSPEFFIQRQLIASFVLSEILTMLHCSFFWKSLFLGSVLLHILGFPPILRSILLRVFGSSSFSCSILHLNTEVSKEKVMDPFLYVLF